MSSFAKGTTVSVDKTRGEVETMLRKIGASQFGTITDIEGHKAIIGFKWKNINIQMQVGLPDPKDRAFVYPKRGYGCNSDTKQAELYEGEVRRRWRCLALALKAKIVAVEDKVTTFEKEFLPYMVTDTGETFGDRMMPSVRAAIEGKPLKMLPALPPATDAQDAEFTVTT